MTIPQDNLIVATFRQLLAAAGPRQAEVLRACAVPRWFDLAVLAVLRGRADGNERDRYIAALRFNHAWASRQAGDPRWTQELQNACNLSAEFCQAR